jgi:phosphatidylserine decarboxylase
VTARALLARIVLQEDINFLLTNRVPRQLLTRFMGWFSRIEQPLVRDLSIAAWKLFADLDLSEARKSEFRSLHDCFTRELKEGARPVDVRKDVLVSPCDGIVGACGTIAGTQLIQAKGFPYTLADLLGDRNLVECYRDGSYVTLRLTSSMYHRFHSPGAGTVRQVNYISGDTWNVNPIALKRVERLFCKNERAAIELTLDASGVPVMLVAVAAILVASIRLHFLDVLLHLHYRGPNVIACGARFAKGEEMGWFQHGSTIIVFAPKGFALCDGIAEGAHVRMGEALLRVDARAGSKDAEFRHWAAGAQV